MIDRFKIKYWIFPLPFFIVIVLLIAIAFIEMRTVYGETTYAIGANEQAAVIAGAKVNKTKVLAFTISGTFAALTGAFLAAKLKSGIPTVGEDLVMMTIAAIVLGGTSMLGGSGGVLRNVSGVLLISLIKVGLNIVGVDSYYQPVLLGVIIISAIYSVSRRGKGQRNVVIK